MIQTQQFEGFPVFGDNSSKSQPEAAVYSNGFAPADVLPAEYYNWLTNKASVGITDLNRGLSSVEEELNNVVTAGGEEPTEETSNQVITAIKYLIAQAKNEAILAAHPVGSLYWSSKNTNPSQLFGGTWTQIKDKFILAAGDTYINGATGGAATVTLTTNQIPSHTHTGPSHTHSFTPSGAITGGEHTHTGSSHWHSYTPAGSVKVTTNPTFTGSSHSHSYTPTGSVKVTTNPTFTGSAVTSSNGGAHTHYLAGYNNTKSGNKWYDSSEASAQRLAIYGNFDTTINTEKASSTNTNISRRIWWTPNYGGTGVGTYDVRTDTSLTHTHSVTASGSISGGVYAFTGTSTSLSATQGGSISGGAYSFTGVEGATNLAGTGATGKATPSMTFTGTASSTGTAGTGATGSTGGGAAHNNMPPYVVKYCWERTA